jgi:tetratricopeptide (TPR) repeat protein
LYDHLGYSEEQLSDYKLSQKYFQKSLDILTSQSRIDSVEYISELRNVARAAWRSGENQKADSLLLLALKASKKVHGSDDVVTSSVMNDIGLFYMTQARYKEARDYYNRSLKIKKAVYGDKGHPNYSATLMNLAVLEETLGNLKVAESLFLRAMHMDIKISGENHPNVAMSKSYLGTIYFKMGKYEKSREYREQTLKMYLKIYGPNHSYLGRVYRDYGEILSVQGEYERAEKYFIKTDSIYTKYRSANENSFAKLHKLRGDNFYYMQKYKAATRELRLASETYNAISPQYYYYVRMAAKCRIKLAQSYIAMGNKKKALSIFNNLRVQMDTTKALVNYDEIDKLFTNAVKSL